MKALRFRLLSAALLALVVAAAAPVVPVRAAAFIVNSTVDAVDSNPGDGICAAVDNVCTLRAAIMEANALPGPDTIRVPAGVYTLTIPTEAQETENTPLDPAADSGGDLDITDGLTLGGVSSGGTVVDAKGISRVFDVHLGNGKDASGLVVQISGLTARNGKVDGVGGGIRNMGALKLADVVIAGNAGYNGGGVATSGDLKVDRSTIGDNVADNDGGGIANWALLYLSGSTLSNNEAGVSAGGGGGGALYNGLNGDTSMVNVTISGNTSSEGGGGIGMIGTVALTNVTISGNSAEKAGGGIFVTAGSASFKNTILADNVKGGNCDGYVAVKSNGYNVDDGNTCGFSDPGDMSNTDPLLGPLQDNGGPTWTHALLAASPARDAGTSAGCPSIDQRGINRPLDGDGSGGAACDVGAYEADGPAIKIDDLPKAGCPPYCPRDPEGGPVINPPVDKAPALAPLPPDPPKATPTATPTSNPSSRSQATPTSTPHPRTPR